MSNEHNNAPAVPQGEPVDFDSIIADIEAIDCVYRGDPSYDYDPRDIREQAANVVRHHATHYVTPAAPSQPAVPQGWTDADSDAARLALELECLLLDTENLSVVSKWWASANEALELHRRRLATPASPSQEPYKDSTPHLSEKEALR